MFRLLALILMAPVVLAGPKDPIVQSVAVIYNTVLPESEKLAQSYLIARGIPEDNLIGIKLPDKNQITREEFNTQLRDPLIAEFDRRNWWERQKNDEGRLQPTRTRIQILVCMRGVPSKVWDPLPKPDPEDPPVPEVERHLQDSSASVDSELCLLGFEGIPTKGQANNPYFKKDDAFSEAGLPTFLVGRIDGPSLKICQRMIADAVAAEKTGLWGMAVVDIANKFPQGDAWLDATAVALSDKGIPTLTDRFNPTLPINYPLKDTAVYFGWYDHHVSGPFKNPGFKFKPGAVAVHLHSFSASRIQSPSQNWCGPLLAKGATATLGNVYEPLLHLTHHFDIFSRRLLDGYTLVESAYMAMPVLSWQGVVLGDPLYRPFLHLDGSGEKKERDAPYRALRIAEMRWSKDPEEMEKNLRLASDRMTTGILLEALGFKLMERMQNARAAVVFREARDRYTDNTDKLRMEMMVAALDRAGSRKPAAIRTLRDAQLKYSHLPEAKAVAAWLNILDPPPPPPAEKK
ncbi:MAG: TIGR03790 family protein [Verrucomicrobiota bacterium]